MIKKLELRNFRGFDRHIVPFQTVTVAVGPNNAGKSTLIEALRIISLISGRYQRLRFTKPPAWAAKHTSSPGITATLQNLDLQLDGIHHRYAEPPSTIIAHFEDGQQIKAFLDKDEQAVFAVVLAGDDTVITNRHQAAHFPFSPIRTMPHVAPLLRKERVRDASYVRGLVDTTYAPQHFRSQLQVFEYPHFDVLERLARETWPGLSLERPWIDQNGTHLTVREGDYVAEIGQMGHGLQIWLQILWFISRTATDSSIVMDEPDVYLHADLQRKLMRIIKERFPQVIVASHSTEIMSAVSPESILLVDKSRRSSRFAADLKGVQSLVTGLGSSHNLHFARMATARKVLLIEGDEARILRHLHETVAPTATVPFDQIPTWPVGGWSRVAPMAEGSRLLLKNAGDESVQIYAIQDRDYRTDTEVDDVITKAGDVGIRFYVWKRKEIENYLINPSAIARVVNVSREQRVPVQEIEDLLLRLTDELKDATFDGIANAYREANRDRTQHGNPYARRLIDANWDTLDGRLTLLCGKDLLASLSKTCQDSYGVSLSAVGLAKAMRSDDIDSELKDVFLAIDKLQPMPVVAHRDSA